MRRQNGLLGEPRNRLASSNTFSAPTFRGIFADRSQTCHVILSAEHFAQIGGPLPAEDDMLDLAYGLTDTSRLGCQIELTEEMDGMIVTVPDGVNNMW